MGKSTFENIIVAGTGRMGKGITLAFAYAGCSVVLADTEERTTEEFSSLEKTVMADLHTELQFLRTSGIISAKQQAMILSRITLYSRQDCTPALQTADVVFEAVAEVLTVKQAVFAWLCRHIPDTAIIASATSTMLVDTLADHVSRPERFLDAHWLNPAHLMPLVEISPGRQTGENTVAAVKSLLQGIGKVPVICRPSAGFIVARIQALAMNEAARLVEEGIASAEDIDKAIRVGFGIRYATLGLLEFIDWGGGDILYYASNYLADNIDRDRFAVPDIVNRNMAENRRGLRDGTGFYDWKNIDTDAYRNEKMASFVHLLQHLDLMPKAGMYNRVREDN